MEMGATISVHHLVVTRTSEQPHKKQVKTLYMTQGFLILKRGVAAQKVLANKTDSLHV